MKFKNPTLLFLTIFLFGLGISTGCSNGEREPTVVHENAPSLLKTDSSFVYFAQSIPILDSSFTLSNNEDFKHLRMKSKYIPQGAALIGKLKPINNYEFIIYSYPADLRLPILEVYNSRGEKVNERILFNLQYCGNDFGHNNHLVKLSSDHRKIFRTTTCVFSFSNFGYDSIIVSDLIYH